MLMLTIKKAYPKITTRQGGTIYGISTEKDKKAAQTFFRHAAKPTTRHLFLTQ